MDIQLEEALANPPQQEEVKKAAPSPVLVKDGAFLPTNNSELVRIINQIAKGGGFPERFDTLESRIAAYNLAHSLMKERWQIALNNIAIIKGSMCLYGEFPGALAEMTKEMADKHVFYVDRDYKEVCLMNKNLNAEPWAGVCRIQRKGRLVKEFTYTIEEATNAGQYPAKRRDGSINNDSPWMKFTKVMLMRKAMNLAIKMEFPDALCGVPIAEYEYNEAPDLVDVTPRDDKAAQLNSLFDENTGQTAKQ